MEGSAWLRKLVDTASFSLLPRSSTAVTLIDQLHVSRAGHMITIRGES
jgi:hypothetical protein